MTCRALRHRSGGGGEDGAVGRLRGQSPAAVEGRDPERRCRRRRQAPDVGTNMAGSPSVTGRGTASSARFLSLTRWGWRAASRSSPAGRGATVRDFTHTAFLTAAEEPRRSGKP